MAVLSVGPCSLKLYSCYFPSHSGLLFIIPSSLKYPVTRLLSLSGLFSSWPSLFLPSLPFAIFAVSSHSIAVLSLSLIYAYSCTLLFYIIIIALPHSTYTYTHSALTFYIHPTHSTNQASVSSPAHDFAPTCLGMLSSSKYCSKYITLPLSSSTSPQIVSYIHI